MQEFWLSCEATLVHVEQCIVRDKIRTAELHKARRTRRFVCGKSSDVVVN